MFAVSICPQTSIRCSSVADHCLKSTGYINVIVSDKQKHLQYMNMDEAIEHCTKGVGIWRKASNDEGSEPDVVMACAGDIPARRRGSGSSNAVARALSVISKSAS